MLARLLALALIVAALPAAADWPERPVKVVVPFAAGGSGDAAARPFAERLSHALGQQFVVENKAGAAGTIGVESVVRAAPDGYTILFASTSPVLVVPLLRRTVYDTGRDLVPVAVLADGVTGIGAHPSLGVGTLAELVALAKRKPGEIAFGSAGLGTITHLWGEALKARAGIDLLHVPYKGISEALNDLLAGHIQLAFDLVVFPHVKAGKLKMLAVSGERRHPEFPDVPTIAEAGFPGYHVPTWYGAYVPTGTPAPIVEKLNAEILKIAATPDMEARMLALGLIVRSETPAEVAERMRRDTAAYAAIIADAKIKLE